jgi:DNA polymerase III alpha subunit
MKTILKDRILWHDGSITFSPDQLLDFVLNGGELNAGIHVSVLNEEIINFNKLHPTLSINVKRDLDHLKYTWNIPEAFQNINIKKYVKDKFIEHIDNKSNAGKALTEDQVNTRIDRIEQELALFKSFDMDIILKAVIYIVDIFKKNKVIWGTGRGSSCASYILYIVGLHSVDSVENELELNEFFK